MIQLLSRSQNVIKVWCVSWFQDIGGPIYAPSKYDAGRLRIPLDCDDLALLLPRKSKAEREGRRPADVQPVPVFKLLLELHGGALWGLVKLCEQRDVGSKGIQVPFSRNVVERFVEWLQQSGGEVKVQTLDELHGLMRLSDYYCIDRLKIELEKSFMSNDSTWRSSPEQLAVLMNLAMRLKFKEVTIKCTQYINSINNDDHNVKSSTASEKFGATLVDDPRCECIGCFSIEGTPASQRKGDHNTEIHH